MVTSSQKILAGAAFAFLVVWTTAVSFGQAVTGSILGRITDTSGAVIPGATIQLQNLETGFAQTAQTDSEGRYLSRSLPLGTYTATVQKPGFRTEVRTGIVLTVASEVNLNVELTVGNVQEKVEVTAEAPPVETTNATLSGLVSQEQIRDLPLNGRSVDQLALLSPGVSQNRNTFANPIVGTGIRLSVNGARPDSMLYLLDGTATNDASNNGHGSASGQTLGVEGILEFRLLTHSFGAEYGRFAGGVVSAVTRSGTNEFHGSVYEFIRNNVIAARNFFNPGDLPAFRRNQFGAAAGGRVIRDRMFFFANYEGLRQRQGVTVTAVVPNAASRALAIPAVVPYIDLYPVPNGKDFGDGTANYLQNFSSPTTEDYAMERMDFRISDKDNFYWRYVYDPASTASPLPVPKFQNSVLSTDHLVVLSETHVFSGASLNEFRFGFNRSYSFQVSSSLIPIDPALSFVPGKQFGTIGFAASSQTAGTLATLGASQGSGTGQVQNSFEESDTFSTVRGAHSLKFGADFVRQDINSVYTPQSLGQYTFGGLQGFLQGQPTLFRVLLTNSTSFTARGWRRVVFGWFVQDDYRVRPNLTINIGLRHEFFTAPAEVNGRTSAHINATDPTNTPGPPFLTPKLNFGPRAGLAWDPTGSGKTSIRAGGGIYYNHLEGGNWFPKAVIDPDFLFATSVSNPVFPNQLAVGVPATAQQNYSVEYHSHTPTVIQYNLEVQRQLAPALSLRVGYVGSHGYHLSRQAELNLRIPQRLADGTQVFPTALPASACGVPVPGCLTNPRFSNMQTILTDAVSGYNGMQVVLQKTYSAGLTFQASYSYAKTMSDADLTISGQANSTPSGTLDPFNLARDYSRSAFDQRHLFVFSGAYRMPWDKRLNSRLSKATLGGWVVNTIYTYNTGIPLTPLVGFNRSQNNDTSSTDDRPDLNPGFSNNPINGSTAGCGTPSATGVLPVPAGQNLQTAARWFDPCAFGLPAVGAYGNLGRNTVTAPGLFDVDFTLVKTTPITERMKLDFRAEFFNLFNHANFGLPLMNLFSSSGARSGAAGQISTTNVDNREMQFGLKLIF